MADSPHSNPEIEQILTRLRQMDGESIALSRVDVQWLLSEIDGGREAFGTLVMQKKELVCQVSQMRRTIDDLSAYLRKK